MRSPPALESSPAPLKLTTIGYVEARYAYDFNCPSNAITNLRGFDNRHNTFSLANAALGANAEHGPVTLRLILQYGSPRAPIFVGEPAARGGANEASCSSSGLCPRRFDFPAIRVMAASDPRHDAGRGSPRLDSSVGYAPAFA